jgi:hypothetical protein
MKFNKKAILIPIGIVLLLYVLFTDCTRINNNMFNSPRQSLNVILTGLVCTYKPLYYLTSLLGVIILFLGIFNVWKNGLFEKSKK